MKHKTIKITIAVIVLIIATIAMLPLAFNGKIMDIAKTEINKQLNAKVNFEKLNLSFFRHFPNATISLQNLSVVGTDAFKKDTLLSTEKINLVVNLKSIFSDSGYDVQKIEISNTNILAHILQNGKANWDIMKESDDTEVKNDTSTSAFHFNMKDFKITNANVLFLNDYTNMAATVANFNLAMNGDFSSDKSLLSTNMSIEKLNFYTGNAKLVSDMFLSFDGEVNADLKNQKYELSHNKILINKIPISMEGWVALADSSAVDMDLKLLTEKVNFKSILSLVPTLYSNSFEGLKADGEVALNAFLKGRMQGENYPAFNLSLMVKNGWFQYPKLPKSISNINVDTKIYSDGGSLDKSVVDVKNFSFTMDKNPFRATLKLLTPISDPDFSATATGNLNLDIVKDVYPLPKDVAISGKISMDMSANGRLSFIENSKYEKLKFNGNLDAEKVSLITPEIKQNVSVPKANFVFNNQYLNLKKLELIIGKNDLKTSGRVENYLGYFLKNSVLKGDFSISSKMMNLNDLMPQNAENGDEKELVQKEKTDSTTSSSMSVVEIPKNIDITMNGDFGTLKYGKMIFENGNAKIVVKNGRLDIKNMSMKAFGGDMKLSGTYDTQQLSKPTTAIDVQLNSISFVDIASQVESLGKIAPIFKSAEGTFSSKLSLNTLLQQDMSPVLSSLISSGSLTTESVQLKNIKAINALGTALKIDKLANLTTLKNLDLHFSVKDGKIETKPFNVKLGDYKLTLGGKTGLDKTIEYRGGITLPDNLKSGSFKNLNFKIDGTFASPKVSLDVENTIKDILTDKLGLDKKDVDNTKENLTNKASDEADKLLTLAKEKGDKLVELARVQGDSLVAKARNPITRELAKKGAEELVRQAQKQADKIYENAKKESENLLEKSKK